MKKYLFSFALLPLLAASCVTDKPTSQANVAGYAAGSLRDQVSTTQANIQNAVAPLNESGQHIDNARIAIGPTNAASGVISELNNAKSKLDEGKNFVIQANQSALLALTTATQTVAAVELSAQTIKKLEQDNADLTEKLHSKIDWIFNMLAAIAGCIIVAGVGICIASAVIGFASVRAGSIVSAGGVALLCLTLTLKKYQDQFTLLCGVLIVVGILGLVAYFCWDVFVKNKANKELVQFGEGIKNIIGGAGDGGAAGAVANLVAPKTPAPTGSSLKAQLFGDNNSTVPNSLADSIQSDSTQAIVKQLRKHLKIEKAQKG